MFQQAKNIFENNGITPIILTHIGLDEHKENDCQLTTKSESRIDLLKMAQTGEIIDLSDYETDDQHQGPLHLQQDFIAGKMIVFFTFHMRL